MDLPRRPDRWQHLQLIGESRWFEFPDRLSNLEAIGSLKESRSGNVPALPPRCTPALRSLRCSWFDSRLANQNERSSTFSRRLCPSKRTVRPSKSPARQMILPVLQPEPRGAHFGYRSSWIDDRACHGNAGGATEITGEEHDRDGEGTWITERGTRIIARETSVAGRLDGTAPRRAHVRSPRRTRAGRPRGDRRR